MLHRLSRVAGLVLMANGIALQIVLSQDPTELDESPKSSVDGASLGGLKLISETKVIPRTYAASLFEYDSIPY